MGFLARGVARALVVAGPVLAAALLASACTQEQPEDDMVHEHPEAVEAARHFLDRYVEEDGRVVRTEAGGDTVSEGQAYGLLLSVALDDREQFARIWAWTREHLQRPDRLLAWHWADGQVVSPDVAPDADLDAARALVAAERRFDNAAYGDHGRAMAGALLERATVDGQAGPVLTAGPWAAQEDPPVLNPSYFSPRAFDVLARATGDERWAATAAMSRELVSELLDAEGELLPPDWAVLVDGRVVPSAVPGEEGGPALYGLDAARIPVRFAASCDPADHAVAARLWPTLSSLRETGLRTHHYLGGQPLAEDTHPLSYVAAAAAARADGHESAAEELLDEAGAAYRADPTYYGAAWVALGRIKLGTDLLGDCR